MKLSFSIEEASNTGNARGMYKGIKQATGPNVKKIAPLKSKTGKIITDGRKQMERWVEHYLELYSTENTVSEKALNSRLHIPLANIFEMKEWAASFTCTLFKLR